MIRFDFQFLTFVCESDECHKCPDYLEKTADNSRQIHVIWILSYHSHDCSPLNFSCYRNNRGGYHLSINEAPHSASSGFELQFQSRTMVVCKIYLQLDFLILINNLEYDYCQ